MRGQLVYAIEVEDEAELNRLRQVGHDALLAEGVRIGRSSAEPHDEQGHDARAA